MKRLVVLLAIIAVPALARVRPAGHTRHVLWIGAHPDDEALVAPLLAADSESSILVLTRGERGTCAQPGGCGADLGSVRAGEMALAAGLLHAHLTLWSFSDVMSDVDATWSAEAGGHTQLVQRIESVILAEHATSVVTLDPNHGSTCHPAHLAVGELVSEAAAQLGIPVMFVETRAEIGADSFFFYAAAPDAAAFDVSLLWQWTVDDAATHASQFTPAQVDALRNVPAAERRIWLSTAPAQTGSCGR